MTQEEDRCATASKAVADLEHRLNDLVSNLKTLDQRIARTSDQRGFLTDYSNKLISAGAQAKTVDLLDDSIVGGSVIHFNLILLLLLIPSSSPSIPQNMINNCR